MKIQLKKVVVDFEEKLSESKALLKPLFWIKNYTSLWHNTNGFSKNFPDQGFPDFQTLLAYFFLDIGYRES